MKKTLLLTLCLLSAFYLSAQLGPGDIAFIGMNTDATEGYSIITLTDIPGGEKIFFSDRGIVDENNYFGGTEGTYLFTAPAGGIACGTIISFEEITADQYSITGVTGATMVLQTGFAQLGSGDQVYAYTTPTDVISSTPSDATFLAGIMSDYDAACVDAVTKWTQSACVSTTSESVVPPGLVNGVNCVSITPSGPEIDNMRYTGSLTGTSTVLRGLINDFNNWETNDDPSYDIKPSGYAAPVVNCISLPVELTEFKVSVNNKRFVRIHWATASESGNDFFTVQRSSDGTNWEDLIEVAGAGTLSTLQQYNEIDENPLTGVSYYRLKQTDFDGTFEFSGIQSVVINGEIPSEKLSIFPNPAKNELTVISETVLGQNEIQIFNSTGQNVTNQTVITSNGPKSFSLDVSRLSSGLFIVKNKTTFQSVVILD